MLAQDTVGMSALDKDIEKAEKHRDMLKSQLGQVMGADVRGQRVNQLTQGDGVGYIDGMLHAYGNMGGGVKAEQERKNEAAAYQGMLHAYGNIGGGVKAAQERKDEAVIPTTRPDPSDHGSSFWDTHEKPDPFRPGDPELAYAPLKIILGDAQY